MLNLEKTTMVVYKKLKKQPFQTRKILTLHYKKGDNMKVKDMLLEIIPLSTPDLSQLIMEYKELYVNEWIMSKGFNYIAIYPELIYNKVLPLLSSHIDTVNFNRIVFPKVSKDGIIKSRLRWNSNAIGEDELTGSPIGGDDRCGVAIMLHLLSRKIPAVYLFCDKEETGCIGSKEFINSSCDYLLSRCSCYIGLDRRGKQDAAVYTYESQSLLNIVKKYGYEKKMGSVTDIAIIQDEYPKAAVNLSVGFYNEHTAMEYIDVSAFEHTALIVPKLLDSVTDMVFNDLHCVDNYLFRYTIGKSNYQPKDLDYYDDYMLPYCHYTPKNKKKGKKDV